VSEAIPSTMPVQFAECTVFVSGEVDAYRPQLGGVVAFGGRLDASRLQRAVRLLLDAEPVLGCRFDPDAKPPVWRRLENLEDASVLDVIEADVPAAQAAAFIAEPLDPRTDPCVRAALVLGPDADTLAVKVSHVAMDGGGLKQALYMIAEYYRRLGEQADWTPRPNADGLRHIVADAGFLERLRALSKSKLELVPESDWIAPEMGGGAPATYLEATVEPHALRAAAEAGRSVGATVNDILLTAYLRVLYRLLGAVPGSVTPVMTTADLRRHLPTGARTALANMSAFWNVFVSPVEGEEFDGTLARVVAATKAWKSAGAGKTDAVTVAFADKVIGARALSFFRKQVAKATGGDAREHRGTVPVLTNIGVIDSALLDFGGSAPVTDAKLLGPVSGGAIAITASTYRDRLCLSSGTASDDTGRLLLSRMLQATAEAIETWADGSTATDHADRGVLE